MNDSPPPSKSTGPPAKFPRSARIALIVILSVVTPILAVEVTLDLLPERVRQPVMKAMSHAIAKTMIFFMEKSRENESKDEADASSSDDGHSQDSPIITIRDGDTRTISGTVLSVADDGILLAQEYFVNGVRTPSTPFFIRGRFSYVDGDQVRLKVVPAGTYKYETAMGSTATVRAYRVKK